MYKSKLQEYCHRNGYLLPEYFTTKEGFDHCPKFKASVVVNGSTYVTPDFCKSTKHAHNLVAKIAFENLTASSTASPATIQQLGHSESVQAAPLSIVNPTYEKDKRPKASLTMSPPASATIRQPEDVQAAPMSITSPTSSDDKRSKASPATLASATLWQPGPSEAVHAAPLSISHPMCREDKKPKDMSHLYKNRLQIYSQKKNISLPVYISERDGPPHEPRFKCKVMLEGKTYECQEYFYTLKAAENAAAKVALTSVSSVGIEQEDPGVFKNLLQEMAQKDYNCFPEYNTISSGPSHSPVFTSTVDVKGESFTGEPAKTKKLAEMYAAKSAYSTLKERAYQKTSESGHVAVKSESIQKIDQNASAQKPVEIPFSRSPSHSLVHAQSSSSSSHTESNNLFAIPASISAHKKVIVFRRGQDMPIPPVARITNEDENWISMELSENNAME